MNSRHINPAIAWVMIGVATLVVISLLVFATGGWWSYYLFLIFP